MLLLAIGLTAAGIGTMVFLRIAQVQSLDEYLRQIVPTDVAATVMDVTVDDGVASFEASPGASPTQYFVAVYGPDGTFLGSGGGSGIAPEFPSVFPLRQTLTQGTDPFELESADGTRSFHASVDFLPPIDGVRDNYTQLIAMPLTSVNQTVASYIGIYTILALLTILGGALLTRWLVTLTFRSLGEVENTAMSIASGDFGQRMGDISPRTEVGKLKTAINAMLDRVDVAISQRDATVRRMRRFIGDASHELRTPLVTVRGYAELYRMGAIKEDGDVAQAMERIEKEARRMGALVEDLLALARLDERRDFTIEPVDLRPIARDAALDARAADPERVVTFVESEPVLTTPIEVIPSEQTPAKRRAMLTRLRRRGPRSAPKDADAPIATPPVIVEAVDIVAPPVVLGVEDRIRQVVANLLGNARRYTPPASPIELNVGVDLDAGTGWIAIVDHGEGVPAQIRERIFERFWRADTSRTRETGGSGLGLSIVSSIIESLNGSIVVEDTPGGGATFRASFPLAREYTPEEHRDIATQPVTTVRALAADEEPESEAPAPPSGDR